MCQPKGFSKTDLRETNNISWISYSDADGSDKCEKFRVQWIQLDILCQGSLHKILLVILVDFERSD